MVSAILKALGSGYTSKSIIKYILSKYPQHAAAINTAINAGYSADAVVNHFLRSEKSGDESHLTEREKTKNIQRDRKINIARNTIGALGTAGALAAGAYSLYRAAQPVQPNAVLPPTPQGTPPQLPNNQAQQALPAPQPIPPAAQMPTTPSPQPNTPVPGAKAPVQTTPVDINVAAQAMPIPQEETPIQTPPVSNRVEVMLKEKGLENTVKPLVDQGLSSQDIKSALRNTYGFKTVKEMEKSVGKLENALDEYKQYLAQQPAQKNPPVAPTQMQPPTIEKATVNAGQSLPKVGIEKVKQLGPKSTIITPNGQIGTVKELKGKIAKVDVDGKVHSKKITDIVESPLDENELADAYDNIMAKTPESQRSAAIFWAGYDEDNNTLGYIPHGGKYYEFKDVPPELAEAIKNEAGAARTEGETREGLWTVGGASRGTLIYNLVEKLRKADKERKERQPEFEFGDLAKEKKQTGMRPIFDAFAAGRNASREREKRKKNEERKKRKK